MLTKEDRKFLRKISNTLSLWGDPGLSYSQVPTEKGIVEQNELNRMSPEERAEAIGRDSQRIKDAAKQIGNKVVDNMSQTATQIAGIPRRAGIVARETADSLSKAPGAMLDFLKGEKDFYSQAWDTAKHTKLDKYYGVGTLPAAGIGITRALGNLLFLPARAGTKIGDNLRFILTGDNTSVNATVNKWKDSFNKTMDKATEVLPGDPNANRIAAHTADLGTSAFVLPNSVAAPLAKLAPFFKPTSFTSKLLTASPASLAGLGFSGATTTMDAGVTHDL